MKENSAMRVAQIVAPVSIQIIATPIHLLGLDLYNRPDIQMKERVSYLKSIYANTAALRMLRFLPAFGIGGIVNIELRKFFNDLDRIH